MVDHVGGVFHGVESGDITVNPGTGGRLYDGSRVEVIWTSPQVVAFLSERQYAHMHLPLRQLTAATAFRSRGCSLHWRTPGNTREFV